MSGHPSDWQIKSSLRGIKMSVGRHFCSTFNCHRACALPSAQALELKRIVFARPFYNLIAGDAT
jgi:hypothetical protein